MCRNARWKREVVPDHKFDFLNIDEFKTNGAWVRTTYVWLYVSFLITVGVYCANIYTAITYGVATDWTNQIFAKCDEPGVNCTFKISFSVGKWIFIGCIIFSFLLLGYEWMKMRRILASRDISYAFTNIMANSYLSLKSYSHFCFFSQINDSAKTSDNFAFFIFFTFKGWKHLLLADAPRQTINFLTLFSFGTANKWQTNDLTLYWDNNYVTLAFLSTMLFTLVVFAANLLMLVAAAICYIPLLCHIQGNLKEYCCHKIDKRIAELIKRKQKRRIQQHMKAERLARAGGGQGFGAQPTLPNISVDDFEDSKAFARKAADIDGLSIASSAVGDLYGRRVGGTVGEKQEKVGWSGAPEMPPGSDDYSGYGPPPMPMYQPSSFHPSPHNPPSRSPSYPLQLQPAPTPAPYYQTASHSSNSLLSSYPPVEPAQDLYGARPVQRNSLNSLSSEGHGAYGGQQGGGGGGGGGGYYPPQRGPSLTRQHGGAQLVGDYKGMFQPTR